MPVPRWSRLILVTVLCIVLAGLGRPHDTLAQSEQASARDSSLAEVDQLRENGQFRDALSELSGLRDTYGDQAPMLWRMSLTRADLAKSVGDGQGRDRHNKKALELAETALLVDSTSAHAHFAKAVAEGRIALNAGTQERVERSRTVKKHVDQALELNPKLAGAYHTRGRWHREVSDLNFLERTIVRTVYGGLPDASFELAVRDFGRAIELENVRFHHLELAKTYLKMDRPSDARESLQTVLDLPAKEPFAERYKQEAQSLLEDLD